MPGISCIYKAALAHWAVCLSLTRSGNFSLSPPANFANSAILPAAKISASLIEILLSKYCNPKCNPTIFTHINQNRST